MRDESMDAVKPFTSPQCSQECLKAQLDSYYKNCKSMKANSGAGGRAPKEDGTANTD
jgi:hypothetical protein